LSSTNHLLVNVVLDVDPSSWNHYNWNRICKKRNSKWNQL